MKFLEYDIKTGRILSEVICSEDPEPENGRGYYEIGRNEELDITQYAVRGGSLVKVGETNQEKLERERIRREHGEQCRRRYKSLKEEYLLAIISRDEDEQRNLEREFDRMKAYL